MRPIPVRERHVQLLFPHKCPTPCVGFWYNLFHGCEVCAPYTLMERFFENDDHSLEPTLRVTFEGYEWAKRYFDGDIEEMARVYIRLTTPDRKPPVHPGTSPRALKDRMELLKRELASLDEFYANQRAQGVSEETARRNVEDYRREIMAKFRFWTGEEGPP